MNSYQIARPYIDDSDKSGVLEVLNSGTLALGPKIVGFEESIAKYTRTKFACAVSNGTSGLHLCVKAVGWKAGDEVILLRFHSFLRQTVCFLRV